MIGPYLALLCLLLPMLTSCSSPPGRYQQTAVHSRDGVPCFGVPDTKETRINAPVITGVSVTEPGKNGLPTWEHDFLRDGTGEPTLPPGQCHKYGEGVTSAPSLLTGKRYQLVLWGRTDPAPELRTPVQATWASSYCSGLR